MRVPILTTNTHNSTGNPREKDLRKGNKRQSNRKRIKLSLLADAVILYGENPKSSPKKTIRTSQ